MNIDKIQKLNQMAMTLRQHNIVADSKDAVNHAANIYGTENNFSNNDVTHYESDSDDLRKEVRRLTFALKNAVQELNELKSTVGKLDKELNDLKVNNKPRVERPQQVQSVQTVFKTPEQEVQPIQKRHDKPIDRNGIAPADVSIDKMFYFGQK